MDVLSLATTKIVNQKAFANNLGVPIGATVNLLPHPFKGVSVERKKPLCCHQCGAVISPLSIVDVSSGKWKCNFCMTINVVEDHNVFKDNAGLTSSLVDYIAPADTVITTKKEVVVFVLDTTFHPQDFTIIKDALKQVLSASISRNIEYMFSKGSKNDGSGCGKAEMVNVHCLPGHTVNLPPSLRVPSGGFHACIQPLQRCLDAFILALDGVPSRNRLRCTGTGIHETLMLLRETRSEPRNERIIILSNGLPSHGPGSIPFAFLENTQQHREAKQDAAEFFEKLAEIAYGMGVVIDLYGIKLGPNALNIMQNLSKLTTGTLVVQSTTSAKALASQIVNSLSYTFGTHGIIDIHASKGLRITSIIGQVDQRVSPDESSQRKLTHNACWIKTITIGRSVSFLAEATTDLDTSDLHIQILLSWRNKNDGTYIERVINVLISPTGNLMEFLKSINPITASVLLTKKIMLELIGVDEKQKSRKVTEIRNGLPHRLSYMAQKFGKVLESHEVGFFGYRVNQTWACPQELWYVSQSLYHLCRGLLMGASDDRTEVISFYQTTFLAAMDKFADRIILPRLFLINHITLALTEIPAITSLLSSEQILLLDHGITIIVWIGKHVQEKEQAKKKSDISEDSLLGRVLQECEKYSVNKSVERGYLMDFRVCFEDKKDAELFYAHLTPSHKDSNVDQASQSTGTVHSTVNKSVKSMDTAALSFYEWCREVNVEPPKVDRETIQQTAV